MEADSLLNAHLYVCQNTPVSTSDRAPGMTSLLLTHDPITHDILCVYYLSLSGFSQKKCFP